MVMTLMMKSIFKPPYWQLGCHLFFNIPRTEKYSLAICYLIGSRPVRREARDGEHIAALVMVNIRVIVMAMVKIRVIVMVMVKIRVMQICTDQTRKHCQRHNGPEC